MGKSHQKGWVSIRGKKWYGYFRRTVIDPNTNQPKTVSTPVALGLKSEMTKYEAREKLELEIKRLTGQIAEDGVVRNGSVTFDWFVQNRYLPLKEADWKEETAKVKKYLIQADLVDAFEDVRLENIDKLALQTHLNRLAKTRSRDRVLQARAYMRAIFAEAVEQDFLPKDPARSIKVPSELLETDKTTLKWDQLRTALSILPLRDRIVLKLDMSNALRPGELFRVEVGLLRSGASARSRSRRRSTRGRFVPGARPKEVSRRSRLPHNWRKNSKPGAGRAGKSNSTREPGRGRSADSSEAFIFPGRNGGFIDSSNYRKRVLHKLAKQLGLPKLTFQVIRRTIATLAKDKGHVKDIQGMMRHSRLATTTEVYMQSLEEGVRSTVNSIYEELSDTGTFGSGPGRNARINQQGQQQASDRTNSARETTTPQTEKPCAKPVRGVVLEFATRLRQSRGREVLPND